MQSREMSLLEATVNTAVGYVVSVASNFIILPAFGLHTTLTDNLLIGLCFTVISLVRSYALRRFFNGVHQ